MLRIIREVRPRFAFVENVPALLSRGIDTVLGDLAEIGYDAEWCVLGADDVGAVHQRERTWILAYFKSERCDEAKIHYRAGKESIAKTIIGHHREPAVSGSILGRNWIFPNDIDVRMDDDVSDKLERIKGLGNAQVPYQMATAFRILYERIKECDYENNEKMA